MKDNLIATKASAQQTSEQSLVDSGLCPSKAEQILGEVREQSGTIGDNRGQWGASGGLAGGNQGQSGQGQSGTIGR